MPARFVEIGWREIHACKFHHRVGEPRLPQEPARATRHIDKTEPTLIPPAQSLGDFPQPGTPHQCRTAGRTASRPARRRGGPSDPKMPAGLKIESPACSRPEARPSPRPRARFPCPVWPGAAPPPACPGTSARAASNSQPAESPTTSCAGISPSPRLPHPLLRERKSHRQARETREAGRSPRSEVRSDPQKRDRQIAGRPCTRQTALHSGQVCRTIPMRLDTLPWLIGGVPQPPRRATATTSTCGENTNWSTGVTLSIA